MERPTPPLPPLAVAPLSSPDEQQQHKKQEEQEEEPPSSPRSHADNAGVLCVEQVSDTEAKALQYAVWIFLALLVFLAIAMIVAAAEGDGKNSVTYKIGWYYWSLAAGAIMLLLVAAQTLLLMRRVRQAHKNGKRWSKRRHFLMQDAFVVLALVVTILSFYVSSFSVVIAVPCNVHTSTTILQLFRTATMITLIAYMAYTVGLMRVWRWHGRDTDIEGAATPARANDDTSDDEGVLLYADAPWNIKLRMGAPVLVMVVLLQSFLLAGIVVELTAIDDRILFTAEGSACPNLPNAPCTASVEQIVSLCVEAVTVLSFLGVHWYQLRRAMQDQERLPTSRYKLTLIFVRNQHRYARVLFFAIFMCDVILQAASINSCSGLIYAKMSTASLMLSVGLYAFATAYLYMPARAGDIFTQEVFQQIAWTRDDIPRKLAARNALLEEHQRLQFDSGAGPLAAAAQAAAYLGTAAVESAFGGSNEEMARGGSMFCMETAVTMIHWAWLAYRDLTLLPNVVAPGRENPLKPFSPENTKDLLKLDHLEGLHEPETDVWAVTGWDRSSGSVFISFRGTASGKNVVTDLQAWGCSYAPHPRLTRSDVKEKGWLTKATVGLPVRVHAGFWEAWTGNGFNERVVAKVKEAATSIQEATPGARKRIFVTGHSLGGALASLASLEIQTALPDYEVVSYTYASPRLGNAAFAMLADATVPDAWAIVRLEDPVPRIPPGSYRRVGQRVVLGSNGSLSVNPSYFEMALFSSMAGKVTEHKLVNYCVGMAQFIKAQFLPTLCLPGGASGAAKLAQKVDLESTLLVENMNAQADLRDGNIIVKGQPVWRGAEDQHTLVEAGSARFQPRNSVSPDSSTSGT